MLITTLILHYNRPQNIPKVIAGIRKQTRQSKILVYDSSGNYPQGSGEDELIRGENKYCLPRYELIKQIDTPYIFHTDDDLAINDPELFDKFIKTSVKHPYAVFGWNGRVFDKDINWEKAYSFPGHGFVDWDESESILCDTINFGVSFFPTEILKDIELNPYFDDEFKVTQDEFRNGDDIWISAIMEKWKIEKRVMPFHLKPLFEWLDEGKYALSKMPEHMMIRDRLCKRFFMGKYIK